MSPSRPPGRVPAQQRQNAGTPRANTRPMPPFWAKTMIPPRRPISSVASTTLCVGPPVPCGLMLTPRSARAGHGASRAVGKEAVRHHRWSYRHRQPPPGADRGARLEGLRQPASRIARPELRQGPASTLQPAVWRLAALRDRHRPISRLAPSGTISFWALRAREAVPRPVFRGPTDGTRRRPATSAAPQRIAVGQPGVKTQCVYTDHGEAYIRELASVLQGPRSKTLRGSCGTCKPTPLQTQDDPHNLRRLRRPTGPQRCRRQLDVDHTDSTCQHDHWRRGHKQMCKKIHRGGNAEQYNADKKYKEAVAVAVEACADDTKGQTCYICTQALHWKSKEGLVRGCALAAGRRASRTCRAWRSRRRFCSRRPRRIIWGMTSCKRRLIGGTRVACASNTTTASCVRARVGVLEDVCGPTGQTDVANRDEPAWERFTRCRTPRGRAARARGRVVYAAP